MCRCFNSCSFVKEKIPKSLADFGILHLEQEIFLFVSPGSFNKFF